MISLINLLLSVIRFIPIFAPIGNSILLLKGVKNLGTVVGKSFVERVFKKIFSKKILALLFKAIKWIVQTVTGIIVNFVVGNIFDKLFGLFWSMSSLGNFIGAVFDLCDGKYDGYLRIYVR